MKYYCAVLLFFIQIIAANAQKLPTSNLLIDLRFLQNVVENGHPVQLRQGIKPNLAAFINRKTLSLPDSVSTQKYEATVREALYELGCVHTSIDAVPFRTKKAENVKLFPLSIFTNGETLFLLKNTKDSLALKVREGDEIVAINGHSSAEIVAAMKTYHAVDGSSAAFNIEIMNKSFKQLFYIYYGESEKYTILYKNKTNELVSSTLDGELPPKKQEKAVEKQAKKTENTVFEGKGEVFKMLNDSVGYLKISHFSGNFSAFYKNVFTYLQTKKIKNLIVDVKDNLGGERGNAKELLSYLVKENCSYSIIRPRKTIAKFLDFGNTLKFASSYLYYDIGQFYRGKATVLGVEFSYKITPKKDRFNGSIFVLTNGYTASSASVVSSYIKHHANGILIGAQTAGGEFSNNGGSFPTISLPKSKIKIKTVTHFLKYDMAGNSANGIVPNYPVFYDITNFQKRDLELEKALSLTISKVK